MMKRVVDVTPGISVLVMNIIETAIPVSGAVMLISYLQIVIAKVPVVTGALAMPIAKPEFQIIKPVGGIPF